MDFIKYHFFLVITISFLFCSSFSQGLPSYITACKRYDPKLGECALKVAKASSKKFAAGDASRGIPALDPLLIKEIKTVAFGNNNNNGIKILFKDVVIKGLRNSDIHKMNIDVKKLKFSAEITANLTMKSKYELSGRLLILPLTGKGRAHVELKNVNILYVFDYKLVKRNNVEYASFIKDSVKYEIGGATIHLENLFNGDKVLGETTNRLLNDNWREVLAEIGSPVVNAVKKAFSETTNILLSQVTYDEFLLL